MVGKKNKCFPITVNIVGGGGSKGNKASFAAVSLISTLQNITAPHQSSPGTPLGFGFISLGFFSLSMMQTWVMESCSPKQRLRLEQTHQLWNEYLGWNRKGDSRPGKWEWTRMNQKSRPFLSGLEKAQADVRSSRDSAFSCHAQKN